MSDDRKKSKTQTFFSVCQLDDRQPTSPRNRFTLAVLYISTSNVASPPSGFEIENFPCQSSEGKKGGVKNVCERKISEEKPPQQLKKENISVERKRRGREREKRFIDFLNVIFMARHFKGFSSSALALLSLTRIHLYTHSSIAYTHPRTGGKVDMEKHFFLRSVLARVLQQNDGCENLI